MSYDIRENWSEMSLTKDQDIKQWKAQRGFTVLGPNDESAALTASGEFFPGAPHPRNPFLRVQQPKADQQGFGLWHVVLTYGYNAKDSPENPLNQLPRIDWKFGSTSEPRDLDVFGNAILNSAGDAPENAQPDEFPTDFFTITINMPYFDLARRKRYANKVNSDVATIPGIGTFQPGQLLCRSIAPTGTFTAADLFVPVAHEFEIRDDAKQDKDDGMYDGFKLRFLDAGKKAMYQDPITGKTQAGLIYAPDQPNNTNTTPTPVSEDVRLDGYGNLFDPSYLVTEKFLAGVDLPRSPRGASVEVLSTGVFLKYTRKDSTPFAGLTF